MTLTYRGIAYQTCNLTVINPKMPLNATYRGQSYRINSDFTVINKPLHDLVYRGVKYPNTVVNNSTCMTQDLKFFFN